MSCQPTASTIPAPLQNQHQLGTELRGFDSGGVRGPCSVCGLLLLNSPTEYQRDPNAFCMALGYVDHRPRSLQDCQAAETA